MIALRSRVKDSRRSAVLYTYETHTEQILAGVIRWAVLRESMFPECHIYLEVDGCEIPKELCTDLVNAVDKMQSAGTLTALAEKILNFPRENEETAS